MKRLFAFLLACVLLCACSACKKESPPAPERAQTTKADPEQTISGLSVRIPRRSTGWAAQSQSFLTSANICCRTTRARC